MEKGSKVVKNYIYNTLYQILLLITPLITTPYVSRILGAEGVGVYSYAQSIATYFMLVGAVGTTLYGQREIAYVQDDPQQRSRVFWEITLFRFASVGVCAVIYLLIFGLSGVYAPIYRILLIEIVATAFDISWFFMGLENFRLIAIRNAAVKIAGVVLVFVLVKRPEDISRYTWCMTLPVLVGNVSLWLGVGKHLTKTPVHVVSGIRKRIKDILILFVPQVAVEVYAVLDKTMLGVLNVGMDQVGYYTQAQKIIKIVLMIVTSLGTVMLPAMSAAFAQNREDVIRRNIQMAFRFVCALAFPLMFGLCAIARRFVPFFFGEGFDAVAPLMMVISPIIVLIGMSNVFGRQYLLPTRRQRAYTMSVVGGAVVNFTLNLLFIPRYAAFGASIATVLAELAVTLAQAVHVRRQLPLGSCLKDVARYFIMGLVMFAAVFGLDRILPENTISMVVLIAGGVVVYAAELLISKDELLQHGRSLIRKR